MATHNSNFALGRYRFAQSKSDSRFGQDRASLYRTAAAPLFQKRADTDLIRARDADRGSFV